MIVITITNPTSSYCQVDNAEYITYKNVVELFFGKYSVAGIPNTSQVRFEKRPDGWHICIIEYTDKQVTTTDELYWDKEKNKFNELHYNKAESEIENFEILNIGNLNEVRKKANSAKEKNLVIHVFFDSSFTHP